MRDVIEIRDLHLRTIIGINDWERKDKQDVLINLKIYTDTRRAGETDRIEDTLNYRTLTKRIIHLVETSRFYLVEKLAEEIARVCVLEFDVPRVEVRVEKPAALRFARSVGVHIQRSREDYRRPSSETERPAELFS